MTEEEWNIALSNESCPHWSWGKNPDGTRYRICYHPGFVPSEFACYCCPWLLT